MTHYEKYKMKRWWNMRQRGLKLLLLSLHSLCRYCVVRKDMVQATMRLDRTINEIRWNVKMRIDNTSRDKIRSDKKGQWWWSFHDILGLSLAWVLLLHGSCFSLWHLFYLNKSRHETKWHEKWEKMKHNDTANRWLLTIKVQLWSSRSPLMFHKWEDS